MAAVLEGLVCAEDILILTGIKEYPECCVYVGQETVFVRLLGQSGQIYHIESVDRERVYLRKLLMINGALEDYLALSDKEQDLVYVYSDEKARELLEEMMGGRL